MLELLEQPSLPGFEALTEGLEPLWYYKEIGEDSPDQEYLALEEAKHQLAIEGFIESIDKGVLEFGYVAFFSRSKGRRPTGNGEYT